MNMTKDPAEVVALKVLWHPDNVPVTEFGVVFQDKACRRVYVKAWNGCWWLVGDRLNDRAGTYTPMARVAESDERIPVLNQALHPLIVQPQVDDDAPETPADPIARHTPGFEKVAVLWNPASGRVWETVFGHDGHTFCKSGMGQWWRITRTGSRPDWYYVPSFGLDADDPRALKLDAKLADWEDTQPRHIKLEYEFHIQPGAWIALRAWMKLMGVDDAGATLDQQLVLHLHNVARSATDDAIEGLAHQALTRASEEAQAAHDAGQPDDYQEGGG